MRVAFLFPGQGSQSVGMGKALAEARPEAAAAFAEVDEALGDNLSRLIFEGPADDLGLTRNTQPALLAVSIAAHRVLLAELGGPPSSLAFHAGHSLGEYAALAAAGSITLRDGARLLRLRGEAMQRAAPVGIGAMAALIGIEIGAAREVVAAAAAFGEVCEVANDNGGGQVVISGHKEAVERAIALAKDRGVKRAVILPVSAPFHSSLMAPAAAEMADALADVRISEPTVPVLSNVTARPHGGPDDIRRRLVEQITGAVRWREQVAFMAGEGVEGFYEIGAGKVLSGLVKRIVPGADAGSAGTPEEIGVIADRMRN